MTNPSLKTSMEKHSIKPGQKLWFVPVDRIYGPSREISIYQTGAIWAYFRDEYCEEARIRLSTNELEFQEGKIYTDRQSWEDSGEKFGDPTQISTENQRHLRLMRLSKPLVDLEKQKKALSYRIRVSILFGLTWGLLVGILSAILMLTWIYETDKYGNINELKSLGFNVSNTAYVIFSVVISIPIGAVIKYNSMPKE